MTQGEFPSAMMEQAQTVPTVLQRAAEAARGFFDGSRRLGAGLVIAGIALTACSNADATPVASEVSVSAAASVDGEELTCTPENVDFSKQLANKEFGTPTSVFPNLGPSKDDLESNISTLQRMVMGDENVAYSVRSVLGAYSDGITQADNLTNEGLKRTYDAFQANPAFANEQTALLCSELATAKHVDSLAAPVGGQELVFTRDASGVTSVEYKPFAANSVLNNVIWLRGNVDQQGLTPEAKAKLERPVYVTPDGRVIMLGTVIQKGDAVLTDHGQEVKAQQEAEAAAAAAAAQAQAEAEAAAAAAAAQAAAEAAAAAQQPVNGDQAQTDNGVGEGTSDNNGGGAGSQNGSVEGSHGTGAQCSGCGTQIGGGGQSSSGGTTGGVCSNCAGGNGGGSSVAPAPAPQPQQPAPQPEQPPVQPPRTSSPPPPTQPPRTSTPPPATTSQEPPKGAVDPCEADPHNPACS